MGGNRRLKRVFYQSAICALNHDPTSKTFYARNARRARPTDKRSSRSPDVA
ncbi:hypothetical protein ACFOUW_37250 [Tenggerimyces flavus]|uniref:Uncharacterized protein n=1 Tax=Tenggerimyces flavus TaxID=1708749 RepID=A0ABV7YR53_9ACTN